MRFDLCYHNAWILNNGNVGAEESEQKLVLLSANINRVCIVIKSVTKLKCPTKERNLNYVTNILLQALDVQ